MKLKLLMNNQIDKPYFLKKMKRMRFSDGPVSYTHLVGFQVLIQLYFIRTSFSFTDFFRDLWCGHDISIGFQSESGYFNISVSFKMFYSCLLYTSPPFPEKCKLRSEVFNTCGAGWSLIQDDSPEIIIRMNRISLIFITFLFWDLQKYKKERADQNNRK